MMPLVGQVVPVAGFGRAFSFFVREDPESPPTP